MADKNILHMVTPLKHMSPFDVNMALDAGYDAVVTYTGVTLDEVTGLVQDAIFSRPPKTGARTGMFFGGKNAGLALDMLAKAKAALVPPFALSLFADPGGSFTTAAAMVACIEKMLRERRRRELKNVKVAVFGGTGVLGFAVAAIAALEGADVTLVGYDGIRRVSDSAAEIKTRFGVEVQAADGSDETRKAAVLAATEVAACCGRAGVRVLARSQLEAASGLLVAADANAVPPSGIEGLDAMANGVELTTHGALGIGPLAIGNIKYKTESGLFSRMVSAVKPTQLDIREAFILARELNG
ncbi:MAG TPA: NAD(P)-dependent methylenetetrahydromethanopterin dehydrogenase [Xanthobacteraceae bacterium]|nr:NAD(P)-dependent methylenetetrahydromethanopterin dehydrogenase [Xanthobacteraceae bacterium]